MTTTNATASTNSNTNAGTSEAVTTSRLTLIAALEAGDAEAVAKVLIKQGRPLEQIKAFSATFKTAVTSFKEVTTQIEADRIAEQKRKDEERAEQDKKNAKVQALADNARQIAIQAMVADLVANDVSPEMALEVATKSLSGATRGSSAPKQKVQVKVGDDVMTVAVTGNNPNKVKDAITASGLTREEFIAKFKVA